MHRLLKASVLVTAILVFSPLLPAAADLSGLGWTDGHGVGASAEAHDSASLDAPTGRRSSGSWPRCRYNAMGPADVDIAEHMAKEGIGTSRGDGPGTWYWKTCEDENGMTSAVTVWAPDRADPEVVARKALTYDKLPDPAIGMSPPAEQGAVVNIPVWFWVNGDGWSPTAASATIDGLTVVTTATPERVAWTVSGGGEVVCDGPGVPYDPARPEAEQRSDCTYLFEQAGTFTVTATVEWRARWTVVGGSGGGDLGVVRRSSSITVQVSEIQALNRPPH